MATTTATLTLQSADLTGDALSMSATTTLRKAGTVTGLDQTSGVGRKTTTSTSQYTLLDGSNFTANKAHKVYIKNTSAVATEYVTVEMNSEAIGRLYAGDWMFFPWGADADTNDIKLTPSVSTSLTVEHIIISEL